MAVIRHIYGINMIYVILSHNWESKVVADDLAPIRHQGICNHHDEIGQLLYVFQNNQ